MNELLAQRIQIGFSGPSQTPIIIQGPTGLSDPKFESIGSLISALIPIGFTLAGMLLLVLIVWGGYDLLLAGGDPGKIKNGRTKITNAFIGFGLVFMAWFLAQMVGFIFGIPTV